MTSIASWRIATGEMSVVLDQDWIVAGALAWLWKEPSEAALLEVGITMAANAYPKLAFGRPITEMEPDAKPLDMEGT